MGTANFDQARSRRGERGVALIIALLTVTVLMGVGFGLMISSSAESLIYSDFRGSTLALAAARGGVEEARGVMGPGNANRIWPPTVNTGAVYLRLNSSINPTTSCTFNGVDCQDNDPIQPSGGLNNCSTLPGAPPASVTGIYLCPSQQTTGPGQVPYVWTKVQLATQAKLGRDFANPGNLVGLDDTNFVCWNGANMTLQPGHAAGVRCDGSFTPVFILTSLAITPGGSRRLVTEVATYRSIPPLPGALVLDGPDPIFNPGSSNNFFIDGNDAAGGPPVPAVGVIDDSDIGPAIGSIPKNRLDHYPGVNPSPDIENVSGSLPTDYQTCGGLTNLVSSIEASADNVYIGNQSGLPNPGTAAAPRINVVRGNLTISGNFTGYGILVVTGNLVFSGNSTYFGVILVIGTGSFQQNGGGNGQFNGGILVANTTGPGSNCPISLGSPSYQVNGGGNNGVQYDSTWTNPPGGSFPVQMLSLNY
jgi:hypothetical protein